MAEKKDGGPAFPVVAPYGEVFSGMSLRDWFAGQALANPQLCSGMVPDWQLKVWWPNRLDITKAEIAAKQAEEYADALLSQREAKP